jgi:hypothetical protein
LGFIRHIRHLGLLSALPGPPSQAANPNLSENLTRFPITPLPRLTEASITATLLRKHHHRLIGGVQRLARPQKLAWS